MCFITIFCFFQVNSGSVTRPSTSWQSPTEADSAWRWSTSTASTGWLSTPSSASAPGRKASRSPSQDSRGTLVTPSHTRTGCSSAPKIPIVTSPTPTALRTTRVAGGSLIANTPTWTAGTTSGWLGSTRPRTSGLPSPSRWWKWKQIEHQ